MTVQMVSIESIKLNDRNPRQMSEFNLDVLCQSIERDPQFMELRPIVVDEQNIILGGNQRYKAIIKLGRKEIPISWIRKAEGLTKEQRDRFILVDNSPEGMSGVWDFDLLLKDYQVPDLEDLGFRFPEGVDPNKEWEGMPEFNQQEKLGLQVVVHFNNTKDRDDFAKLVEQNIGDKTDSIWYPKQERRDIKSMGYEGEEDSENESAS